MTVPKTVRDLLRIVPGSKVDFRRAVDGSVVPTPSRMAKLRGHAGKGLNTDAITALTRGEA